MNKLFINIKVDREERPDLDMIYQKAHQLLTQRPGGWPLTMFIDPEEQRPFFGGTYFPNEARYGMPAFTDLITRIATYFAKKPGAATSGRICPSGPESAIRQSAINRGAAAIRAAANRR